METKLAKDFEKRRLLNPRIVYYENEVKWIADLGDVATKPMVATAEKPVVRLRQENIKKAE